TSGNQIIGNYIGPLADGTSPAANSPGPGVYIFSGATGNFIGATGPVVVNGDSLGGGTDSGNVISFNAQGGIRIDLSAGNGNAIQGNSIFSNGGLGIDLKLDGVTANDNCDGDTGPNNLQNFPVLTSVVAGATNTTITGTLNSTANTPFRIEFFASP